MSNTLRSIERAKKRDSERAETITVTVGDLINARPILNQLLGAKFPAGKGQLSLAFARLCRDVFKALETGYDPPFNELLKKHGTESPNEPGQYSVEPDQIEAFKAAIKELISAEIVLAHRPLPELVNIFPLSGNEALRLEWLLDK